MIRPFFRLFGWLPLLLLILAAFPAYFWHALSADARALAARGVEVEATVVELKHIDSSNTASGTRRSREEFLVSVTYSPPAAEGASPVRQQERRGVSEEFFRSLQLGQGLMVKILAERPEVVEIEPGWVDGNASAAGWVSVGLTALGLLPLPFILKAAASQARIAAGGLPRQGRVIEKTKVKGYSFLRFEWTGADGVLHRSQTRARSADRVFGGVVAGNPLPLLEDPANPARAFWTGDLK